MEPNQSHDVEPEKVDATGAPGEGEAASYPLVEEAGEFPIVGIGASAGGLLAFERFFTNLPPNPGMAFVVIQHLSRPYKSILSEILQRYTAMRVMEVTDGVEVKANHVYVIPPGDFLALTDGHLILLQEPIGAGNRFPIDHFFRSLAEVRKSKAIGVVLSGTASDGSLGVKTIKAEGGLTIAQQPDTADFGDMPRNAIATHDIDYILPPEKMGDLIIKYVTQKVHLPSRLQEDQAVTTVGSLQKLYFILRSKTGHDFSLYKQTTLLRRIDRRIKIALVPNLEAYIQHLQQHPEEIDALFHEMLINVTTFFRDPEAFKTLAVKAIRPLIHVKSETFQPLRVWVPGCSSGEEAYSIAILIHEEMEAQKVDLKVQIYATDLDNDAIATARRGIYADGSLEHVSQERLKRFFIKEEDGYYIKKTIRDCVVFSTQNLIYDPPFSRIDLLSCRNVLIYLQPELQKQLYPLYHYSLNPGGVLFLGNSESISGHTALFSSLDRKYKIYQRQDVLAQHPISHRSYSSYNQAAAAPSESVERRLSVTGLRDWTERELLKYHTPACLVIDDKNNILYIHGRTGKYLEPSPGESNDNLFRMAREGLKSELATALHASGGKETVVRQGIRVKTNGDYQYINLIVRPVEWEGRKSGMTMVVFEDVSVDQEKLQVKSGDSDNDQKVADLEKILKEKDDYLTSIINELEDTNQELKSINEELLSSNEEMQSSNEELETSREELQSINEELSTVNAELQNKNAELTMLNNDVYNLLASTEIGTIFVDLDLRLRRFTPAIGQVYHLLSNDIGRPLVHFRSNLNYEHLIEDVKDVLDSLVPKTIEIQGAHGNWYLVNIQPYRTLENVVDGAVITFVDITKQKQTSEQRQLDAILRASSDAVILQDFNGTIQSWNPVAAQLYGWSETEALGMNYYDLVPESLHASTQELFNRLAGGEKISPIETERLTHSGRVIEVLVTFAVIRDGSGSPTGWVTTEREQPFRKQTAQRAYFENRALRAFRAWYLFKQQQIESADAYHDICRTLVQEGGYALAWAGRLNKEAGVKPVLSRLEGYYAGTVLSKDMLNALTEKSWKVVQNAVRDGRAIPVRSIATGPEQDDWRSLAHDYGFNSLLILPVFQRSNPQAVLAVYAAEVEAFTVPEIESLQDLANLAFIELPDESA